MDASSKSFRPGMVAYICNPRYTILHLSTHSPDIHFVVVISESVSLSPSCDMFQKSFHHSTSGFCLFVCLFVFVVLGLEIRAYSISPFFVMGFFEIGSRELFAWAGFEL
jgi:hypothetical protein